MTWDELTKSVKASVVTSIKDLKQKIKIISVVWGKIRVNELSRFLHKVLAYT